MSSVSTSAVSNHYLKILSCFNFFLMEAKRREERGERREERGERREERGERRGERREERGERREERGERREERGERKLISRISVKGGH